MNAFAVRVQQSTDTSVMGRVHATWSPSLAAAGVLGVAAAALEVPVAVHVAVVASSAFVLQLAVGPHPVQALGPGGRQHPAGGLGQGDRGER